MEGVCQSFLNTIEWKIGLPPGSTHQSYGYLWLKPDGQNAPSTESQLTCPTVNQLIIKGS